MPGGTTAFRLRGRLTRANQNQAILDRLGLTESFWLLP